MSRWAKIGGWLAIVVIGGAVVMLFIRWPFRRDNIVKALQETFSSTVEWKAFHGTYLTPGCVAEGLILRRDGPDGPPIATIEKLTIQGAYWEFLVAPERLRRVRVEGLRIFVTMGGEGTGNAARSAGSGKPSELVIDEIIADGAVLEVASAEHASGEPASGESGKEPLEFDIHKLTLNSVAGDRAMSFHAALLNAKPPGEIRTDGKFGPLRPQNLGQTLVSGSYVFERADLGIFAGIGGTLSSTGKFNGVLERIEVDGSTDVPDFKVTRGDHAVDLRTQFHAIVNGMNGDVTLQSVQAQFEQTSLVTQGEVAKKVGSEGKTVSMGSTEPQGRIQDWLRLLSKADRPALTGAMNFTTQIRVPPGKQELIKRVSMQGDFRIDAASFVRSTTQGKVDGLSHLAQGEKQNDDAASVVENLKGHVALNDAIATFSNLSFSVPGALARVHGTCGLLTEHIDLHGTLQVDNKLSKGSKGIKSVLLKSVEPFLKKKNTGEIVPIRIGGTFSHPSYGLDMAP